MRIDKYLKVARLAKRRSEAHEALLAGRITCAGRPLKPGYVVKTGDVLELHYARRFLTVRVLVVPERVTPKLRDVALYEVVAERRDDPVDWLG
ncbi:MAG: S4 domain-containing protein, partial [Candidatus Dormibacteria bacterium]